MIILTLRDLDICSLKGILKGGYYFFVDVILCVLFELSSQILELVKLHIFIYFNAILYFGFQSPSQASGCDTLYTIFMKYMEKN